MGTVDLDRVEFGVLGPVELNIDNDPVPFRGNRARLLAILLANRRAPLSSQRLADALWPDDPTKAVPRNLYVVVSNLRDLIEPDRDRRGTGQRLLSTSSGYRLEIDDRHIDEGRFRQRLSAGRQTLEAGDMDRAVGSLRQALDQWRGSAYGEHCTLPAVSAAANELEELRLVAEEHLAKARLEVGDLGDLVAHLEGLVAHHPFRERLWRHLMLALYRAGRQADALDAYRRCRRILAAELGLEPGTELQSTERAILLQDDDVLLGADFSDQVRTRPARLTRTRHLPTTTTSFLGRGHELGELKRLTGLHRTVTVVGPGGVGKTRLVVEFAHNEAEAFRHGVAFVDLVGVQDPSQVEAAIAEAVGLVESSDGSEHGLEDHLRNRHLLLVVDNAEHLLEAVARTLTPLIAACPQLNVCVTSRAPLEVTGERILRLMPLDADDAASPAGRLFVDRAGLVAPTATLDDDLVSVICARLDGLPLAIELAASRLSAVPLGHIAETLDDQLHGLAGATAHGTSHGTLDAAVDWSIRLLDDQQQALLRKVAVFAGGFTAVAAGEVCDLDSDPVEALAELVRVSLVQLEHTDHGNGRYRLLAPLRADGLARMQDLGELETLRRRHQRWATSVAPETRLAVGLEVPAAVDGVGAELENMVAAITWSLGADPAAGVELLLSCLPWWVHQGRPREARRWLLRALDAHLSTRDRRHVLVALGLVARLLGDHQAALSALQESLLLAPTQGDELAIEASIGLVHSHAQVGELGTALERLQDLEAARLRDPRLRALLAHERALVARLAGDRDDVLDLLEDAVALARTADLHDHLVAALGTLSQTASSLGDLERGHSALSEALAVARRHGLVTRMARLSGIAGLLATRAGDSGQAAERFRESLSAATSIGDGHAELSTLINLGAVLCELGEWDAARSTCEDAVELADRLDQERFAIIARCNLCEAVLGSTGDFRYPLTLATEGLRRAVHADFKEGIVVGLEAFACALARRGDRGDHRLAARLLGSAMAERTARGWHQQGVSVTIDEALEAITGTLGPDADDMVAQGTGRDVTSLAVELIEGDR